MKFNKLSIVTLSASIASSIIIQGCAPGGAPTPTPTLTPVPTPTATPTTPPVVSYSLGGNMSDLISGGSITLLEQNSNQTKTLTGDGAFTFDQEINDGSQYSVVVDTQPSGQLCTVNNAFGTFNAADIDTVEVSCIVKASISVMLASATQLSKPGYDDFRGAGYTLQSTDRWSQNDGWVFWDAASITLSGGSAAADVYYKAAPELNRSIDIGPDPDKNGADDAKASKSAMRSGNLSHAGHWQTITKEDIGTDCSKVYDGHEIPILDNTILSVYAEGDPGNDSAEFDATKQVVIEVINPTLLNTDLLNEIEVAEAQIADLALSENGVPNPDFISYTWQKHTLRFDWLVKRDENGYIVVDGNGVPVIGDGMVTTTELLGLMYGNHTYTTDCEPDPNDPENVGTMRFLWRNGPFNYNIPDAVERNACIAAAGTNTVEKNRCREGFPAIDIHVQYDYCRINGLILDGNDEETDLAGNLVPESLNRGTKSSLNQYIKGHLSAGLLFAYVFDVRSNIVVYRDSEDGGLREVGKFRDDGQRAFHLKPIGLATCADPNEVACFNAVSLYEWSRFGSYYLSCDDVDSVNGKSCASSGDPNGVAPQVRYRYAPERWSNRTMKHVVYDPFVVENDSCSSNDNL